MARRRGGNQPPANPAPVSGPGALSQRTDGGPGQPVREIPAEQYGDRQANANLQGAAPMASQDGGPPVQSAPPAPIPMNGVFGPTSAPGEALTAGLAQATGAPHGMQPMLRRDPQAYLRYLYSLNPDPSIARLIDKEPGVAP